MRQLEAMETFLRVVNTGSFARAAEQSGLSRAVITKRVRQLETALHVKLMNRTTRRMSLTEIGHRYFAFCNRILEEMRREELDLARLNREPYGELTVLAPKSFGSLHMGHAITSFVAEYPRMKVTLTVGDVALRSLDPVEHGVDLAIRLIHLPSSSLYSRRIGTVRWIVCASPAHVEKFGAPQSPADLADHPCIIHKNYAANGLWRLRGPGGTAAVKVAGPIVTNSVLAMRSALLAGAGLALMPTYCVAEDLRAGRLLRVLEAYSPPDQSICAVYPHATLQPRKVRLFVNHLARQFRASPWEI